MTRYLTRNQASLYLGSLLLTGQTTDSAGNVFTIEAQAAGADWGSAQPIDVAVQRWMTDGATVVTRGYDNREIAFQVKISANSSLALAMGEDALVTAARAALSLTWVPPEGSVLAAATVFDLWTSHLEHQLDVDEENRLTRTYQVTCAAKPWARSRDVTTATAVTTGGTITTTSVDTAASATGWTATINGAAAAGQPTVIGGTALRVTETITSGKYKSGDQVKLAAIRSGSVTGMGTTPYLAIDWRNSGQFSSMFVTVDGQACTLAGTAGTVRYWRVPVGVTSFTTLSIASQLNVQTAYIGTTATQDIYDVSKTNVVGSTLTHKMLNRHLDVGGSVPTNGSIQIASPSTILGNTLVYSGPEGSSYSPPLRQYRVSGGTVTADATMVSGSREVLSNQTLLYSIPAGALRPATYAVVGRFPFAAAATLSNVIFRTLLPGTSTPVDSLPAQTITTAAAATVWLVLGTVTLPPVAQPTESAVATSVHLQCGSGTASTLLDELFLLDVTNGSFSLVTSVSPATFTRLWLDSPDATNGPPQIYFGANADRSDATRVPYAQILSMGDHDLDPDGSMVFTVTDAIDDAVVTATYYQRWHTHAAA